MDVARQTHVSVRRNIVANYAGQIWPALIGLVLVPVYIRFMGIEAYGLIGIFALLQTWLALLDLGMTPALSREMARFNGGSSDIQSIRDLLRSVEVIGCIAASSIALAVWASSAWLASHWLQVDEIPVDLAAQAFAIMGGVTGLRFVEDIYRGSLIGLQRQVILNVIVCIGATVRAVGALLVLTRIAPTITAFFIWQGVVSVAMVLALAAVVYGHLPRAGRGGHFSLASLRNVWIFAMGTLTLTVLGFVLSQADKFILTRLLTLKEFAYYSLAFSVDGAVRLLAQPVDQSIYPRLTALLAKNDHERLAATYHRGVQLSVVLLGSAAMFLAIFGEETLGVWTRDPELALHTYPIMAVLVSGMMLNGLLNGPFYLQMAAGWTGLLIKVNAVLVLVFVPVIYLLVKWFGALGGAAAWVIINLVYMVVVVPLMHRRLLQGEMSNWLVHDLAIPLAAALAILGAFRMIMPGTLGMTSLLMFLAGAGLTALIGSALAASQVRREIVVRLTRGRTVAWSA
jgi:O-antigen/teichoic acid export membrane protein